MILLDNRCGGKGGGYAPSHPTISRQGFYEKFALYFCNIGNSRRNFVVMVEDMETLERWKRRP